jgi:hypothetical protein
MDHRQTPIGPNPSDADLRALLHDYLFRDLGSEEQQLAFDDAAHLLSHAPEDCWRLIQLAAKMDLTTEQIAYFAAGPVEDILGRYGNDFVDRLEVAALGQPIMRRFVAGVWRGRMSDAIWARILDLRDKLEIDPL